MKKVLAVIVAACLLFTAFSSLAEETVTVSFEAEQFSLAMGKTLTLKVTISPRKSMKLEWSSSDESIASVNNKGIVKGLSVGETTITVKSAEDESVTASCKVAVVLPVKKISFNEKALNLPAGLTQKPEIKIEPENATNQAVTFSSSNEKVATVDENGVITGVSKGSAKITAVAQDGSKVKGVIKVKVEEYDMIFTSAKPQTAKYYYNSGRYTITGKVKTGCVSIPNISIAMWAMVAGGPASEEFEVTPVKPGTDTITIKAGRLKTVIRVYVSPDCFKEEETTKPEEADT